MAKKSVWLINQYLCTPELNGDGHRHSYLAEEWIKKGYDVTLITSSFSHVPYRDNDFKGLFKLQEGNIRTLLIKGNRYKETQGVSRILSWLIFSFLLFFIPIKKLPNPDIIIVSSNSLLPILNVVYYFKKKFKKVKFILEIRDIWPLTLIELGGFSSKNIFIRFLAWVEKLGYKKADHIVSLLVNTDNHIKEVLKSKDFKYSWISNGFSLSNVNEFEEIPQNLQELIPKNKFIIGYAGSLGTANAMEYIIDVVKKIKDNNICLCIVGDGNDKEKLIKKSKDNENIIFLGKLPKNQVFYFLNKCDLLYFSSRPLNIYKFGISANKTFDYMYAKKPILLSASTNNNVVELAKCGSIVPSENEKELAFEILKYKAMPLSSRTEIGENGYKYLLKHFTYEKLAQKFTNIFNSVI